MAKNATINMRIDEELKAEAERIFRKLGLTTTEAIKIFLSAVRNKKGLPFPLQLEERGAAMPSSVGDRKAALEAIIGKYPNMTSSEEFARQKQEEIEFEERKVRQ